MWSNTSAVKKRTFCVLLMLLLWTTWKWGKKANSSSHCKLLQNHGKIATHFILLVDTELALLTWAEERFCLSCKHLSHMLLLHLDPTPTSANPAPAGQDRCSHSTEGHASRLEHHSHRPEPWEPGRSHGNAYCTSSLNEREYTAEEVSQKFFCCVLLLVLFYFSFFLLRWVLYGVLRSTNNITAHDVWYPLKKSFLWQVSFKEVYFTCKW